MKIILTLSLLFFSAGLVAQNKNNKVQVDLGLFYSQKSLYRGALIWDSPMLGAGPRFTFFNAITLAGPGLTFFKEFLPGQTLSLGLSYFDDNEPGGPFIFFKDETVDFKNKRGATIDSFLAYEFRFKWMFATKLEFHQDLKRNKGKYLYYEFSTNLIPFVGVGFAAGLGDKKNNQYVYGPDGSGGLGHVDYFVSHFRKGFLPWGGNLLLKYTRVTISKDSNSNADFIRGIDSHDQFNIGAFWAL